VQAEVAGELFDRAQQLARLNAGGVGLPVDDGLGRGERLERLRPGGDRAVQSDQARSRHVEHAHGGRLAGPAKVVTMTSRTA
jgi:hypothetical protein